MNQASERDIMLVVFPGAWAMGDGVVHASELHRCTCKGAAAEDTTPSTNGSISASIGRLADSLQGCLSNLTTALTKDVSHHSSRFFSPEFEPAKRCRSLNSKTAPGASASDALAADDSAATEAAAAVRALGRNCSSPAAFAATSKKLD
ncbi:hypothetical protein GPECTOR_25g375 [Gonium pectorale]|uniref:Uncharacterized protein n=1 Tax=Gonium pectorale TaxID=33097 RepID=A0A150GG24_GONPE|nr:hypothetical protein GPECTOR_25g375 [Gonium pectorale]|eukprot:KXZ48791.1 hypothetical protein GPECTOR_25g375 [Gonium pectorale]